MPTTANLQLDDASTSTINIGALERSSSSSYSVSEKRGRIVGTGTTVSGAGAWSKVKGSMKFKIIVLEKSATYNELRKSFGIQAGVAAFFAWLGVGANVSANREAIQKTMQELSQQSEVEGLVEVDMEVSGQYPNVEVSASAYITVMQVENKLGSATTFNVASAGSPNTDIGAQDQQGNKLPTRNPNNTIDL